MPSNIILLTANHRAVRRLLAPTSWFHIVFLNNDLYFEALSFLNVKLDISANIYEISPGSLNFLVSEH